MRHRGFVALALSEPASMRSFAPSLRVVDGFSPVRRLLARLRSASRPHHTTTTLFSVRTRGVVTHPKSRPPATQQARSGPAHLYRFDDYVRQFYYTTKRRVHFGEVAETKSPSWPAHHEKFDSEDESRIILSVVVLL